MVFISDLQKELDIIPTYDEIVECERKMLKFFGWDLGFILVIHYVEIFLANGVLFESEEQKSK